MQIEVKINPTNVLYTITAKKGIVTIECSDDKTLLVKGPKEIISSSIGGRGDENEKEAWFEDKDFNSASEAVSNVLEILKTLNQ